MFRLGAVQRSRLQDQTEKLQIDLLVGAVRTRRNRAWTQRTSRVPRTRILNVVNERVTVAAEAGGDARSLVASRIARPVGHYVCE